MTCQTESNALIRASALLGAIPFDMLWFFVPSQPASGCSAMIFLVTKRCRRSRLIMHLERQSALDPVFIPPLTHPIQNGNKGFPSVCQTVFYLRRDLRILLSVYKPIGLQFLQGRA